MHPILFWVGGQAYSTYPLLTSLGYITGLVWLRTQIRHHKAPPKEFWKMALTVVGAGLIGGKLGFFIVERRAFLEDPWAMISGWNTGWVFWSGLLMGMLAGVAYKWWYNRRHRPRAYLPIADYCVTALAIGHVLGRLGCFMEGCCHGRPTAMPWGVVFSNPACSVDPQLLGVPLHPTQLYEAFGEAFAAFILIRRVLPGIRAARWRYGTAFFGYVLYYSALRFIVEFYRGDDRGELFWSVLSPSQWASLFVGVAVAGILWTRGVVEHHPKIRSLFADGKAR